MPGLRDILDAATPGIWECVHESDEAATIWADGFCIAQDSFRYARHADFDLMALAPELAALCLDMGEHIREHGFGAESDALLARLDQLGKEPSDG